MTLKLDTYYSFTGEHTDVLMYDEWGAQLFVSPTPGKPGIIFVGMRDADGRRVGKFFERDELDGFIAELQRARSGCFDNEYPKPKVPSIFVDDDEWFESLFDDDEEAPVEDAARTHRFVFDPNDQHLTVTDIERTNRMVVPLAVGELLDLIEGVQADEGDTIELHVPIGV